MADEVDYEALPPNAGTAVNMLAGALAGISEHAVMYPVDSIKTRMQVFSASPAGIYTGVGQAFTRISSTEGMRALWRGVSSVVLGAGPAHAVHFGVLEAVKELAGGNRGGSQWVATSLAGASATIAADALMNPFDVIKQRMQVHKSEFRSVYTCAKVVFRNEGLGAFYVSYPTTLAISIPFNAIQYTVYEQLKRVMNPKHEYSPGTHITAGAVAGAVAAAVTTPLDVAKTILQTRGTSHDPEIRNVRGMMDALRIIWAKDGLKGYARGLTPRVITIMPSTALCWLSYEFFTGTVVEAGSLVAVLPVTLASLSTLNDTLSLLISPPSCVSQVLIVCPESLHSRIRTTIRQTLRAAPDSEYSPGVSLYSWNGNPSAGVLIAATQLSYKWLLLLDDTDMKSLSDRTRRMLLCPILGDVPIGPRGVAGASDNLSCLPPSSEMRPASYLLPPFALPASLVSQIHGSWSELGRAVSDSRKTSYGGVVRGYGDPDLDWCNQPRHSSFSALAQKHSSTTAGLFLFLLPNIGDLRLLVKLMCRLQTSGHSVKVLLYSEPSADLDHEIYDSGCHISYQAMNPTARLVHTTILDWVERIDGNPDVIFALKEPATQLLQIDRFVIVRVPRDDLPYVYWMGSLSLVEWQRWHVPQIELSIITQNRTRSLERLLSSLSRGRYFGDSVSLRMNLEQSSEFETIRVVDAYQWNHGTMFTHRRVIHGGLLPAVVESWYPHSNHSYGVLLEDDVELSPFFYAWIKMAILRYRYGESTGETFRLFGVSLYQQKNIELHPEGRRAFDPRRIFAENGIVPSTPYLSQIPCSWGAVYFPEHWREFHSYLADRLSETTMEIDQIVVPNVRSNNWTKSWKKYFIELVYLRGYVMLYPNYEGFISLSTNHLEVGSHVKEVSKEKQDVFRLPLMELDSVENLLSIPGARLPEWKALPVLNLTGFLINFENT
ncbi:hypothetical protein R3P38DRAFT_3394049 [Favolaschia claudopus]|uniref:Mitochondrial carrier protein n=1 Tax=Favolaschia claudopus TaxID=2862362 RepID=A0AAW0BUR3_9AGAR